MIYPSPRSSPSSQALQRCWYLRSLISPVTGVIRMRSLPVMGSPFPSRRGTTVHHSSWPPTQLIVLPIPLSSGGVHKDCDHNAPCHRTSPPGRPAARPCQPETHKCERAGDPHHAGGTPAGRGCGGGVDARARPVREHHPRMVSCPRLRPLARCGVAPPDRPAAQLIKRGRGQSWAPGIHHFMKSGRACSFARSEGSSQQLWEPKA